MKIIKQILIYILWFESRLILKKYKPEIIAVTGNIGKTSAKDAIFEVVKSRGYARKSPKNYNSEIGVPLAILNRHNAWHSPFGWLANIFAGLRLILLKNDYPKILVLEVSADHPGDIEKLSKLLNPRIAVVTAIGEVPAHVEFFAGPEDLAKEKSKILANLDARDFAILNFDDLAVLEMRRESRGHVLTYGFGQGSDIQATDYKIMYRQAGDYDHPEGSTFKVNYNGAMVPFRIFETFGKPQVYAALAAVAVGVNLGMNLIEIAEALSRYRAPAGRLRLIEGIRQAQIIDDSYNASPQAMHAALDLMREFSAKRKIAVLGDMLELGEYTELAHRAVAQNAQGIDILITVGTRAKFIADEARARGFNNDTIREFLRSEEAAVELKKIIGPGDWVLVKGSESMRMEKVVETLMAHPDRAPELLVRQEEEWKNK